LPAAELHQKNELLLPGNSHSSAFSVPPLAIINLLFSTVPLTCSCFLPSKNYQGRFTTYRVWIQK